MEHAFWHERWQLNQIGFHNESINQHLQAFWPKLNVAAQGRVFVPLCGKSRDMLWLSGQGYEVVGVELSPLAVQAFFAENNMAPSVTQSAGFTLSELDSLRLFCGDFFQFTQDQLGDVDVVWDRASLVAFPLAMRADYAMHLRSLLKPGSEILLVAFDYPQHEMQGPPFSVQKTEVEELYSQWCDIEWLFAEDILAREPHFRERGLSIMQEHIYRLIVR